jgi:hypothetical protein
LAGVGGKKALQNCVVEIITTSVSIMV